MSASLEEQLRPYQPSLPLPELVLAVNNIYHSFEASQYDRRHPEIFTQLPQFWHKMALLAQSVGPSQQWRVLDFGCGTGFEAQQILTHLGKHRIASLTCYDPSPEMMAECQRKIAPLFPAAVFTSQMSDLQHAGTFTMLITNSLLHHLPDPYATLKELEPHLSNDALWLAEHEPSSRFYANPECVAALEQYQAQVRATKYLQPRNYMSRIQKALGVSSHPVYRTAVASTEQGIFKKRPPSHIINAIVDFHLARNRSEAQAGRGFDFKAMQQKLAPRWKMLWATTYSFMEPFYEGNLPPSVQQIARNLATRFPYDGANFTTVWQHKGERA